MYTYPIEVSLPPVMTLESHWWAFYNPQAGYQGDTGHAWGVKYHLTNGSSSGNEIFCCVILHMSKFNGAQAMISILFNFICKLCVIAQKREQDF